jgi:hypothetical protein
MYVYIPRVAETAALLYEDAVYLLYLTLLVQKVLTLLVYKSINTDTPPVRSGNRCVAVFRGAQLTCFTSTKVQILTHTHTHTHTTLNFRLKTTKLTRMNLLAVPAKLLL